MEQRPRLSVVLPAHDEEDNITLAIGRVREMGERLCDEYEIVIVDDGSKDATARIVRDLAASDDRIKLIQHETNLGYGEALRTGFRSATKDWVFFTDADNQFDLAEIEAFISWTDRVDVVAGYRIDRQDPFMRRFFAKGWNILVRMLFYVPVRDIDCAFKLFRRSAIDRVDLESIGAMVNTELMVKLARSGASVVEIGVTHLPRTAGKASGARPRVIFKAFSELWHMRSRLRSVEAETFGAPPSARTR
ncbi:MAG: glycosyltransferase family 2 protein [Actinomycetota bacterium]